MLVTIATANNRYWRWKPIYWISCSSISTKQL